MNNTTLIVIDMQNDFLKGTSVYSAEMLDDSLVENVGLLIDTCRARNIPIIYTQHSILSDKSNAERGEPIEDRACIVDTHGWEIIDRVKPHEGDVVVRKDKYDAFVDTNINTILKNKSIEHVILCGVLTNNCVRATAEGAHYKGYRVSIVSDCCGGTSMLPDISHETLHDIALRDLATRIYGLRLLKREEVEKGL